MPITLIPDDEHRNDYKDPCAFAAAVNGAYDDMCRHLNKGQLIGSYELNMTNRVFVLTDVSVGRFGEINFGPYDQRAPLRTPNMHVSDIRLFARHHGLLVIPE